MLNDYLEAGGDEDSIVISRKEFEDKLLDREREAQIEVLFHLLKKNLIISKINLQKIKKKHIFATSKRRIITDPL